MSVSPWTGEARDREAISFLSASLDHLLGCTEKSLLSSAQHRPPRGGRGPRSLVLLALNTISPRAAVGAEAAACLCEPQNCLTAAQ